MAHNYAINDESITAAGPRPCDLKERSVYTIVSACRSNRRPPRYRIKSKTENVERVVTEEQISGSADPSST